MGRKTIILTENQFNEICGTNTAYLDNPGDYTADGTIRMRTDGAVSNSYGGREDYSDPPTTSDIAHSMAPETLFALLHRNGGHGLWGHWGSGLRAGTLDGFDNLDDDTFPDEDEYVLDLERDDEEDEDYIFESNSELEGRKWNGNSYTNLTTKKTQYKQQLDALRKSNAPAQQIKRAQAAYMGVCSVLDRETNQIKNGKKARMNLGMPNQFQKAGGSKESGNGKAHTKKKVVDPNVGEGFITYK